MRPFYSLESVGVAGDDANLDNDPDASLTG